MAVLIPASIGLRGKTGRAIAVVLAGSLKSPIAVKRAELIFATSEEPDIFQPYHEVMDLPWDEAQSAAGNAEATLNRIAAETIRDLLHDAKAQGLHVRRFGIVGAPQRNLEKIGSPHIRAHAAEGVLFRRILEHAVEANRVKWRRFAERGLEEFAARELRVTESALRNRLTDFGRTLGRLWRADEKAAATGALLALAGRV